MANVSILNLPVAIGLSGAEYLPLVQGGTTMRAQVGLVTGFNAGTLPQSANAVYSGPSSGAAAPPAFRSLVLADLPQGSTSGIPLIAQGAATAPVYGTAIVAGGGTGQTTLTAHNVLLGEGASNVGFAAPSSTSGVPLVSQGSSSDPAFGAAVVAGGGTGLTSLTAHAVMLGEGTSSVGFATIGTAGRLLIDQGSGSDPAFTAVSGDATIAGSGALTIANNAVSNAKFRQGVARSVVGVTGNATANVADIQGTANQVLVVNSGGTALAFGAVNVASSSAVTGALGVANGGTGTGTAFTQNSIVFAGASGVYSQDNAALSWNDSSQLLTVAATGAVGISGTTTATLTKFLQGSSGTPILTATPTASISRYETIGVDTESGQNAALFIAATGNNVSQGLTLFTGSISGTVMNVTLVSSGALFVGQVITGSGVTAGTTITSFGTGSGQTGTYNVNHSQSVGSEALVATGFIAQVNGATINSTQIGQGDVVGLYVGSFQQGTLGGRSAFGGFFNAQSTLPGAGAYGLNTFVTNSTGFDNGYSGQGQAFMMGLFNQASGGNLLTAGVANFNNGAQFDIGYYNFSGSVKSVGFRDDSSSIAVLQANGAHTKGIDFAGATFSGNALNLTGFTVDGSGNVTSGVWNGTTVAVAHGGTNYTGGAWTTFIATVAVSAGSISSQSSNMSYLQIGKIVFINGTINITTSSGTSGATVTVNVPVAPRANVLVMGREQALGGKELQMQLAGSSTTASIFNYDDTNPTAASGAIYGFAGCYEAA